MKPEVRHETTFTREFKGEAVKLIRERGVTVAHASRDLDVHGTVLGRWGQECTADAPQACGEGELLLLTENRTHGGQDVRTRAQAKADVFDYIELLLQSHATALDARLSQSDGVRNGGRIRVGWCQLNLQQLSKEIKREGCI